MYKQISINGLVVNVIMVKAIQNNAAWLNIYADNADNVGICVTCHSLPKKWFDDRKQNAIVTGGNEYKNI